MKKILTSILTIAVFLLLNTVVDAAVDAQITPIKTTFEMNVIDITRSLKTDDVQFDMKIDKFVNPQSISSWKIRLSCDKDMTIQFTATSSDICRKATKFDIPKDNAFSFIFNNGNTSLKQFSLKLKAYDAKGKWIHTETETFRWK